MALGDRLRALKKPVAATPINIPTNPSFEYSDLLSPPQTVEAPYVEPQAPVGTYFGGQGHTKPAPVEEAPRSAGFDPFLFQGQAKPEPSSSHFQWNQPEEEATAENPIRGNLRGQFGDAAIQDIIDEADSSKTGL